MSLRGRRGLGYNEKLSLYKFPKGRVKELVLNLAGRETRSPSWKLERATRDNYSALTARLVSLPNLKELGDHASILGENPRGEIPDLELVNQGVRHTNRVMKGSLLNP